MPSQDNPSLTGINTTPWIHLQQGLLRLLSSVKMGFKAELFLLAALSNIKNIMPKSPNNHVKYQEYHAKITEQSAGVILAG
jgi:hypothetical protein